MYGIFSHLCHRTAQNWLAEHADFGVRVPPNLPLAACCEMALLSLGAVAPICLLTRYWERILSEKMQYPLSASRLWQSLIVEVLF